MKPGTNCKFCKKPIVVETDDEYSTMGDPLKILSLAACNRCADLRIERRKLESSVKTICTMRQMDKRIAGDRFKEHQAALEALLKGYANMIARWHLMSGMSWDDKAVAVIMEHPEAWPDVLATLWRVFRDANKGRRAPVGG